MIRSVFDWKRLALSAIGTIVVAACGKSTEPKVPASVSVTPPSVNLPFIGASQQFSASVLDKNGTPINGQSVTWSSNNNGVATISAAGLAQAVANGTAQITAAAGAVSGSATVTVAVAGTPAAVVAQAGDNQTMATGATVTVAPTVLVRDAFNNPVANTGVTFAVASGGGTLTGASQATDVNGLATVGSWTLGSGPGANTLTATVTGSGITGNPVTFHATGVTAGGAANVTVKRGNGQTGLVAFPLNFAPAVLVRDASNLPVAGAKVGFAVTGGGGSVTGDTALTDNNGVAAVGGWTVQPGANTMTATVTGAGITGNPVTFSATGQAAAYNIDVRYLTTVTGTRKAAFDSAVARWQRMIYGDVPDIPGFSVPANQCFAGQPAINETVDDIVIFVILDSIDGPGKILGQAGPCYIRTTGKMPIMGLMHFDTADVANLEASGRWTSVILHEMVHVLGFGTIWSSGNFGLGLLVGPALQGGTDPHFIGSQGLATFDRIGGTSYTGGAKVPVENCLAPTTCSGTGAGTSDSHWRETTFGNELMTGFINSGNNPLSVLSVASMGDEGYLVNYAAADPYSHTFTLMAGAAGQLRLENDVLKGPIYEVDASGRVVGMYRR
jgi:hypothetical protein